MQTEPTARVSIFASYAPQDTALQQELKEHLRSLQQQGLISLWADTDSNARTEGEHEVDQHLNTAQIILLLVSPDFLASDYCYDVEMKRALKRHERGEARVMHVGCARLSAGHDPVAAALGARPASRSSGAARRDCGPRPAGRAARTARGTGGCSRASDRILLSCRSFVFFNRRLKALVLVDLQRGVVEALSHAIDETLHQPKHT